MIGPRAMAHTDPWSSAAPLPEATAVDRDRFEREIVPAGRPMVLRGLVADWPLVAAARQSDEALAGYLAGFASGEPAQTWVAPAELDGGYGFSEDFRSFNHDRQLLPMRELLRILLAARADDDAPGIYAGAIPVPRTLPGLETANPNPLLDPARDMLVSLWIGNHSKTATHWDLPQNLACVVTGKRRVMLFPTDQVANLYVGPLDVTLAGQPTSLVDPSAPDYDRFPRFREALAHAQVAELGPGDALYIPSLWWHHVETLGRFGAMLNFWWRDGPEWMTTPLHTLLHGRLTLRDLPPNEKHAWRVLFDHYLFGEADPMAHLPEAGRGAFAEMTPERLALLKERLARPLTR